MDLFLNWWTGVVWIIVMFLSAVWTLILTAPIHSQQRIYWWASDTMLHFSKSDEETWRPGGIRSHFHKVFIFGLTIPKNGELKSVNWLLYSLPVFSQPSSSLLSEQSSSPSQRHDKRTHRPDIQRNWSAMHIDVPDGEKEACDRCEIHTHTHTHTNTTRKQLLTAVLFIGLVVAVVFSVTPPACIYTHATAAHELCRTAGLVGGCVHTQTHTQDQTCTHTPKNHRSSITLVKSTIL